MGILKKEDKKMIVYRIQLDGQATDLRFEKDDYVLQANEMSISGDILPDIETLHSIDYLKKETIMEVKAEASRRINTVMPDWKIIKHRDQIELGVPTSLSAEEYIAKQQKRQAIRDASNIIEAEINAMTNADAISALDIAKHPAWPHME
jgi:hypothetical protein